jgi:hypothetical protein
VESGIVFDKNIGAMILEKKSHYRISFGLVLHHAHTNTVVEVFVNEEPSGISLPLKGRGSSEISLDFIAQFSEDSKVQLVVTGGDLTLYHRDTNAYFTVTAIG